MEYLYFFLKERLNKANSKIVSLDKLWDMIKFFER